MRVAAALVAALCLAGTAAGASRPALRILDRQPLTVRGTSFKAGERVTLLINAGKPVTKRVLAGPGGGFTLRLGFGVEGCTSVVVQAIGARGSRAMVDVTRPGCDERPE